MRYFTKEWYALCLKTFLAELLEDDERAATKDEDFYNEVLKQRLGERVFALNKATPAVHKKLRIYCDGAQRKVDETLKAYEDYYNSVDVPSEIDDNLGFHDAVITSAEMKDGNLRLDFDISQSFATKSSVTFADAKILEKETEFEGCVWLYDELYPVDGGYELHILAQAADMEHLVYFTVFCKDILF